RGVPLLRVELAPFRRAAELDRRNERVAVELLDRAPVRRADRDRLLEHGLEDRVQVERRSADDLEHVRRRRLLLQGVLRLVEEADVLDRDRSLAGEGLDQLDLTIGESPRHPPGETEDAEKAALGEDRHAQPSPGAVLRQ